MAIYIVLYLLFTISGLILIKMGAGGAGLHIDKWAVSVHFSATLVIGLASYAISFLLWIVLLKKYDLSYIVPLTTSISYIGVIAGGVLLFGEKISLLHGVAIALILAGVVLLNIPASAK